MTEVRIVRPKAKLGMSRIRDRAKRLVARLCGWIRVEMQQANQDKDFVQLLCGERNTRVSESK